MPEQNKCQFNKEDGTKCEAWAMKDSDFCFFHNPAISDEEKKEAQGRGGQGNKIKIFESLPPLEIKKGKDVIFLLEETINEVRAGRMDIKIANCLGFLAGHLIRAIEATEIQNKVEDIEKIILERRIIK